MQKSSIVASLFLVCATGIFLQHLHQLWPFTVDDAFISFRYAEHLAHHRTLAWNLGQPPVEGYTSFLAILLLAIGFLLHIPILIWAKLIGIFAVVGIGIVFLHAAFTTQNPRFSFALSAMYAFFLVNIVTAIHAVSGLETTLYFFLFFSTLRLFLSINLRDTQTFHLFSLLCLLTGLTRPEANLYNLILLVATLIHFSLYQKTRVQPFLLSTTGIYFIPGLLYFLWRLFYYQTFWPLPFYIKFHQVGLFPGLQETVAFLRYFAPLFFTMMVIWIRAYPKQKMLITTYAVVFISYLLFSFHALPLMAYSFRYAWPLLALVFATLWFIPDLSPKWQTSAVVLLCIALAYCLGKNHGTNHHQENARHAYITGLAQAHIPLGQALSTVKSQEYLATCDAGAISFYSQWPVIDSCALNNKALAIQVLSPQQQANYIFSQHPRVIILISQSPHTLNAHHFLFENTLYQLATQTKMKLLKIYRFQPDYYLWVMGYSNDKAVISALKN